VVSQPPFPILLLTTTGARTVRSVTVPLGFAVDDNGRVFVMASKAGAPKHPAWFHNLKANPSVTVELGDRSFQAQAVVTEGEERDRLYGMISDGASEYEKNTDRFFPSSSSKAFLPRPDRLTRSGSDSQLSAGQWKPMKMPRAGT
jgi:deazaflavin-dependent oxidoreductase (nitroreductase family)